MALASPPEAGQAEDAVSVSSSSKEDEDEGGGSSICKLLRHQISCNKLAPTMRYLLLGK